VYQTACTLLPAHLLGFASARAQPSPSLYKNTAIHVAEFTPNVAAQVVIFQFF
jgi:hypothetical protein